MDAVVSMTATQLALIWPLLGFLFIWMILFGVLAFRPERSKQGAQAGATLVAGSMHTPSSPAMLHVIAQPTPASGIAPLSPASVASMLGPSAHDSSNNN